MFTLIRVSCESFSNISYLLVNLAFLPYRLTSYMHVRGLVLVEYCLQVLRVGVLASYYYFITILDEMLLRVTYSLYNSLLVWFHAKQLEKCLNFDACMHIDVELNVNLK